MTAAMEAWWERLDDDTQAAWLRCFEAGEADPNLIDTLPPDQRSLASGRWVYVVGTAAAGQPDAKLKLSDDFDRFLGDEYDLRRVDE